MSKFAHQETAITLLPTNERLIKN